MKKDATDRPKQIQNYLHRLSTGESLEAVRADFVKDFREVEASEIMLAEQALLQEGVPLSEVQKLCDVHSALFHGMTQQEKIANAEQEVIASFARRQNETEAQARDPEKQQKMAKLAVIPGHPLHALTMENQRLEEMVNALQKAMEEEKLDERGIDSLFEELREVGLHYAKKGDLLYPHLNVEYGISGPSDVMWTVDDEIRDALSRLYAAKERAATWWEQLRQTLSRMREMIYKESNILYPLCAVTFSDEDWIRIYRDLKAYAPCFGVMREKWKEAEAVSTEIFAAGATHDLAEGNIRLPGGQLTVQELRALLNTIPMEITFVDAENINRFFNEGPKLFKRPNMALGREVFSCHPPKIQPMVHSIIESFRQGTRDVVPVWMKKEGREVLVSYYAVRDAEKNYLGTMELVQDMEFARRHQ